MVTPETTPYLEYVTFVRSSDFVHKGSYSYKITKTIAAGVNAKVSIGDNENGDDLHGLEAEKTYTFEVWVYVPTASGVSLSEVFISLWDYVPTAWENSLSNNPTAFDEWQKLTVTRTMRSSATGVLVRLYYGTTMDLNEYFYVDDVKLIEHSDLTIERDEDYDDFQLIDDSAWTIKKTDWNGDADDLPVIDFGANNYRYHQHLAYAWVMKNMIWKGSTAEIIKTQTVLETSFKHNLFIQLSTGTFIKMYGLYSERLVLENCIFFGSGSSHGIQGVYPHDQYLRNVAVYNCGYGMLLYNDWKMENVNCGIELPNSNYDMYKYGGVNTEVTNLRIGEKNGGIVLHLGMPFPVFLIENYNSFGVYEKRYLNGQMVKKDVVIDSGDPHRRSNGADSVIEISCNTNALYAPAPDEWKYLVFEHEFEVDALSKNYRYYVQCKNMSIVSIGELFLECEYVDQYVSASVYNMKKVKSDELIAERIGADDWSQYLEVTGIYPAVKSKVRIRCYLSKYDADGRIFIDPKVGIFT